MDKKIAFLLRRFLTGKATNEEKKELDTWYNQPSRPTGPNDGLSLWPKVKVQIWSRLEASMHREVPDKGLNVWLRPAIAATIALAVGLAIWFWSVRPSSQKAPLYAEYTLKITTAAGEVKKNMFSDGTTVWLNAASTLSYRSDYGTKTREVLLNGEAYFEVAHDTVHPFIVHTRYSTTRVVGTSFTVRAYPGEVQMIGVATGKVQVQVDSADNQPIYSLIPGDKVSFDPQTAQTVSGHADLSMLMCWKDNALCFDSLPLTEVSASLQRKYKVPIRIANPVLARRQFRGSFQDVPLQKVLETLSLSMSLTITANGDTIIISE